MTLENSAKLVVYFDKEGIQGLKAKNNSHSSFHSTIISEELVKAAERQNFKVQRFTKQELKIEKHDIAKIIPRNFTKAGVAAAIAGLGVGMAIATEEWNPLRIVDGIRFVESRDKIILSWFPTWTNDCWGLFILHSPNAIKTEAIHFLKDLAKEIPTPISDKAWKETQGWRKDGEAMFAKTGRLIEGFKENLWKQLI
jgi:hypothetical protein